MGRRRRTSRLLALLAFSLAVLLLVPSTAAAVAAKAIDASRSQRLELPD